MASYQQQVLDYMAEHPNKEITAEEVAKHFDWPMYKAASRFANARYSGKGRALIAKGDEAGTWKYVPPVAKTEDAVEPYWEPEVDKTGEPPQLPSNGVYRPVVLEEIRVTVIKECDGEMVVVDDHTNIYRMVKVA